MYRGLPCIYSSAILASASLLSGGNMAMLQVIAVAMILFMISHNFYPHDRVLESQAWKKAVFAGGKAIFKTPVWLTSRLDKSIAVKSNDDYCDYWYSKCIFKHLASACGSALKPCRKHRFYLRGFDTSVSATIPVQGRWMEFMLHKSNAKLHLNNSTAMCFSRMSWLLRRIHISCCKRFSIGLFSPC